ncbi:MAG: dihydrofolate reductase [Porticoccus sp.]|jgi:dihydrofolate reductase|nr:dihydrofolate reductase [Porticoccus sp.]
MTDKMRLSLIVAMANNRTIGLNNTLPWHLPGDLKYFKSITMGKPIVMGRKTFDSIGKPLPGRLNIVITRNTNWSFSGVEVASSLDQAKNIVSLMDESMSEIMVIGGSEIYNTAIDQADRLYITRVQASFEGDTFFPLFDEEIWHEVSRQEPEQQGETPYFFQILEKI